MCPHRLSAPGPAPNEKRFKDADQICFYGTGEGDERKHGSGRGREVVLDYHIRDMRFASLKKVSNDSES